MKSHIALLLATGWLGLVGTPVSAQDLSSVSAYAKVEVVSVDPLTRLVVIKDSKGVQEVFELDDRLVGVAGVKAGDTATLTVVSGTPGRKRISGITRLTVRPARPSVATAPLLHPTSAEVAELELRVSYTNQVAALSQQAQVIDNQWSSFVQACDVKQASSSDGGRGWFGLWDGRASADLSGGFCRDLFNQIVTAGESVKKQMVAADDVARKTMAPGDVRDIRRLHSMEWEGWGLPAPDQRVP